MNKYNFVLGYLFQILIWFIIIDVLIMRFCFHIGIPIHYEQDTYYIQSPYVSYISNPIAKSYLYNRYYDKDESIFNELKEGDIKVAFFAGSTGLFGKPSLCNLIKENLSKKLKKNVFVANFSICSGTSRQHLHMLLEYFNEFKPDIIIFYNGFNEIVVPFEEEPRPGYPYNQYYVEIPEWKKCLVKYSAIFGVLEENYSIITHKKQLKKQIHYKEEDWKNSIVFNYFDVFEKSKMISENMKSDYFGKPLFIGFFQPFVEAEDGKDIDIVDTLVQELTHRIRVKIPEYDYIYDVHDAYNIFDKTEIYDDVCHVHGKAHILMAEKISDTIYNELKKKNLLNSLK